MFEHNIKVVVRAKSELLPLIEDLEKSGLAFQSYIDYGERPHARVGKGGSHWQWSFGEPIAACINFVVSLFRHNEVQLGLAAVAGYTTKELLSIVSEQVKAYLSSRNGGTICIYGPDGKIVEKVSVPRIKTKR